MIEMLSLIGLPRVNSTAQNCLVCREFIWDLCIILTPAVSPKCYVQRRAAHQPDR